MFSVNVKKYVENCRFAIIYYINPPKKTMQSFIFCSEFHVHNQLQNTTLTHSRLIM